MRILRDIAQAIANLGITSKEQIILGRHNYYDTLPDSIILIDIANSTMLSSITDKQGASNMAYMQASIYIETRGAEGYDNLVSLLAYRNTEKFRLAFKGVDLSVANDINTFRQLRGANYFQRHVMTATCRYLVQVKNNDNYFEKFTIKEYKKEN